MQFKKTLKYPLFSFLLLLAVISTAVGGTATSPATGSAEKAGLSKLHTLNAVTNGVAVISNDDYLSGLFLSHTQPVQTGGNLISKRVQGDKDLLLLHSASYSIAVKTSSVSQIRFADHLTHVSLFLFPYHFFW